MALWVLTVESEVKQKPAIVRGEILRLVFHRRSRIGIVCPLWRSPKPLESPAYCGEVLSCPVEVEGGAKSERTQVKLDLEPSGYFCTLLLWLPMVLRKKLEGGLSLRGTWPLPFSRLASLRVPAAKTYN